MKLIDADAIEYAPYDDIYNNKVLIAFKYRIDAMPVVDAKPVRHGKWIDTEPNKNEFRKSGMAMQCSVCGHRAGKNKYKTYKYCPWCGAKMDEVKHEIT